MKITSEDFAKLLHFEPDGETESLYHTAALIVRDVAQDDTKEGGLLSRHTVKDLDRVRQAMVRHEAALRAYVEALPEPPEEGPVAPEPPPSPSAPAGAAEAPDDDYQPGDEVSVDAGLILDDAGAA